MGSHGVTEGQNMKKVKLFKTSHVSYHSKGNCMRNALEIVSQLLSGHMRSHEVTKGQNVTILKIILLKVRTKLARRAITVMALHQDQTGTKGK